MKFGLIGDLHLGKLDKLMGPGVGLQRQVRLFEKQIAIFRSRGIRHAALLGDLYDDPYPTQELLIILLKLLSDSSIDFLVYPGNHDFDDADHNSLKLLRELPAAGALTNVTFVSEPSVVNWCDMRVFVLPWAPRYAPIKDRVDLIMFHDCVVGARSDSGTIIEQGGGLSHDFFRGITAVSGHLHTPQRCRNIHFVGTSAQLSFGERPEKRLWFGEKMGNGVQLTNIAFEPPWRLVTERYDEEDPPACDVPGTLYSLDVSRGRPGPRWMAEHPAVKKTKGSDRHTQAVLTEKIATLTSGAQASDRQLLLRWLRENTALDKDQLRHGLRIDRELAR